MTNSSHQGDSEADPETTANLKDLAQACSRSLKRALAEEEAQEATVAAKKGFWASRQFAEFNLWCTKIGIHAQGLRSIDARLKDVPDICSLIRSLLQSLERDLNDLLYPAEANQQAINADDFGQEDSSDDSSLSFDSLPSFDCSESESISAAKKRNGALRQHIEDTIDRLHGHALQIDKAGAKHRQERIEIYRQKEGPKIAYDGFKKMATAKAKDQFPNASENFRERIAESFARRRIRFEYLEKHQTKRDIDVVIRERNLPSGIEPKPSAEGVGGSRDLLPRTEGPMKAIELGHQPQRYQNTVSSATEITKLDLGPKLTVERPKRPESIASVALRHYEFPKPPRVIGSSFRCPYCCVHFRGSEAKKARWVEHVMQDFEPYFCTVEDCTTPFDVPNTFNGLLGHLQSHLTQQYHVDLPNGEHWEVDEEGFEKHLLTHNDISVETYLTIKEASRRKGVFMFQSCPFCGGFPDDIQKRFPEPVAPEAQIELRQHIKRHMQDIALFLPPYREDEKVTPQSSASSQINSQDRNSLEPPEDFRNTCDLAVCDCKHFGEYPEESASTSRVIPGLSAFTASNDSQSDETDADCWAGLFPTLPRYDKSRVGEEHPNTLTSMANLASMYTHQGRWKEAEELEVWLMETRKRVLGEEHPNTLTSMASLTLTYRNQGRWKEAEELEVWLMETRKRVLGEEHPDTLTSMASLASMYTHQGRWKEAEELEVWLMETRKRVLGEEHPDTLVSMANLAATYRNQGRWKEAEKLEVRVMEMRKRVLREEHPDTLTSMANLASTYTHQGRWKEAEELEVWLMETRKRVLGEEHPDTLTSMANLASTYRNQGRWKEAEELEVWLMETRKRVLGEEHPDTLTSMANLASTYRNQGRWKEAEELFVWVMETRKRVLGEEHPNTLMSMHNLAFTWKDLEQWEDAMQLLQDCVRRRENVLGVDHPDTMSSALALSDWELDFGETSREVA